IEVAMNHFRTCLLLLVTGAASAGCQDVIGPSAPQPGTKVAPSLEITFKQSCGLPPGRRQAYDPKTGVVHVHFESPKRIGGLGSGLYERSAFEVTKITGPFVKPLVFQLTGVPASYGCLGDPLALSVGGGASDRLRLDGKS